MLSRHWWFRLALSLSVIPAGLGSAQLWGGEPLRKLVPMQLKCPPACPPVEEPCQPKSELDTATAEGTQGASEMPPYQGGDSLSASEASRDLSYGLAGLNADRSTYNALQNISTIGDFFAPDGQSVQISTLLPSGTYIANFSNQPLSPGSGIGRFKTSDSNSPLPRDRVFLDYSLFHNARLTANDMNLQRFNPGFERTFIDGLTSLEIRMPIAMTLNSSTFGSSNDIDSQHTEFGNIAIAAKGILWSTRSFVLTSGLVLQTPTADDVIFGNSLGEEALRIENNQYRLLPYLATLHYNDQWIWQNYLQIDTAANGNKVYVNNNGKAIDQIGVLQEQNYLYLDTSLSRWLYRSKQAGLAMTFELHYNTTINDTDTIGISDNRGTINMGTPNFSADIVNMNLGPTFVYGKTTTTVAYGTPLSEDRGADGELRVLLNRFF